MSKVARKVPVVLAAAILIVGCGGKTNTGGGIGDDCTEHSDCDGICYDPGAGDPYCTDTCDSTATDPCPDGFECVDVTGLGFICERSALGALGDDCVDGSDCASGFCNGDVCSECEGDGDCPGGGTCEDDTAGVGWFVCEGGTLGALGDDCTDGADCLSTFCNGDVCSECEGDGDCDPGLTCEDDTAGVGWFVCEGTALGNLGDACVTGADCVSTFCNTLVCSECEGDGDCAGGGTCEDDTAGVGWFVCEGGTPGDLGTACDTGADCASDFCNGSVCSECEGDGDCDPGLTCEDDMAGVGYFVCEGTALGALGDACTTGADCASTFCNTLVCSECEGDGDCAGGETCVDDVAGVGYFVCLASLGALGDDCTVSADCASGFCYTMPWGPGDSICSECEIDGDCTGGSTCDMPWGSSYALCVGTTPLGDACTVGTDCESGFCNDSICSECESSADCTGGGACIDDTAGSGWWLCSGGLGDDCTDGTDCNSTFCYDAGMGPNVCSECAVDGDCTGTQVCWMGWGDDWASCVGSSALGDACTTGADCESGFCNTDVCSECLVDGDCGGGTCTDDTAGVGYFVCLGALGDNCMDGTECSSGFCFNPPGPGPHYCSECEVDEDCTTPDTCQMGTGEDYATCQ